jgi:hypothetical protein
LKEIGISKQTSGPYRQDQNGVAEKAIDVINLMIATMIFNACLPVTFWGEALFYAVAVINVIPAAHQSISAFELWTGRKPKLHLFHPFGCEAWPHISAKRRKKFQPKSTRCIFLGFEKDYKAYRLLEISSNSIITSSDVRFVTMYFQGEVMFHPHQMMYHSILTYLIQKKMDSNT